MLYILIGQDDFSLTQALEKIKREIGDQTVLAASTTTLSSQQATPEQLSTICQTVPFFGERRLVIVQGLLERFEPRRNAPRQPKDTRTNGKQNELKSLSACLGNIPESTTVVLLETKVTGSNPLFRELSKKAMVQNFPLMRDVQLRQWVQRHIAKAGGIISPTAVALLTRLVGNNLWIMANEIDKLVLFASGRRIEEEDVKEIASDTQQVSVFAMADAIVESKAGVAQQLLQQLLNRGDAPTYLLSMLLRQAEMVVRARELKKQRKPDKEIQQRLAITSEFVLKKTLDQARQYSLPRLKQLYHQLLEADLAIKTGKYDVELALNILVAELCQPGKTPSSKVGTELKPAAG